MTAPFAPLLLAPLAPVLGVLDAIDGHVHSLLSPFVNPLHDCDGLDLGADFLD